MGLNSGSIFFVNSDMNISMDCFDLHVVRKDALALEKVDAQSNKVRDVLEGQADLRIPDRDRVKDYYVYCNLPTQDKWAGLEDSL